MTNEKIYNNDYQPTRDNTCESSLTEIRLADAQSRRKHITRVTLTVLSIGMNLIAVTMLCYSLHIINQNNYKVSSHTYSNFGDDDNKDFTPLQFMGRVAVEKVPADANVLLQIQNAEKDTLTMRLYQIKSVEAKLDENGHELYRTFFLSLGHTLVIQQGVAVLYDESGRTVLAEYDLEVKTGRVNTAEEMGAKQVDQKEAHTPTHTHTQPDTQTQTPQTNKLRRLFFIKEKSHMKGPVYGGAYGPGYGPGFQPAYGPRPYCPYCGMYSYNGWGNSFGGGYPYGGGMGMGGFGMF